MSQKINLGAVAEVNQAMRQVVSRARRVYLIALNAMFMSRKTNQNVAGFSSVTLQLRNFSDKLTRQIEINMKQVEMLVTLVANNAKAQRRYFLLDSALQKSGLHQGARIGRSSADELNLAIERSLQALKSDMERTLVLIGTGQNLVVLAKIEANLTGGLSQQLRLIADDMENVIIEIEDSARLGMSTLSEQRMVG